MIEIFWELLASTLRLSTPLLLASMGGFLCERSGVATLCLEGVMLFGAWIAASATWMSESATIGVITSVAAGAIVMGLHAFLTMHAKVNPIVSGVAINLLAAGTTPLLTRAIFGSSTQTPSIDLAHRVGQPWPMWVACALPGIIYLVAYRSGVGLRLLAAGDGPAALETAGISPRRVRWVALLLGGAVTGLAGSYLSIFHGSQFTRDMTAGRGYLALTALIFGNWRPIPAGLACLFFGFFDALQIRLQSTSVLGFQIPVQFVQCLPYIAALVALAGFLGKSRPPLSIGEQP